VVCPPPIINHQSSIINHQSSIINHPSSIINHQSSIINHQSSIINHQSSIINHQSSITNHQSPITNHQSPITNHPALNPSFLKISVHQRSKIFGSFHGTVLSPHTCSRLFGFSPEGDTRTAGVRKPPD
jgi:hypothetical protein